MLGRDVAEDIEAAGMTELSRGQSACRGECCSRPRTLAIGPATCARSTCTVRRGEIVGLAGLLGSGRTEAARAIFGLDPLTGGAIRVDGAGAAIAGPRDAIAAGIGFLTEDRKAEGIVPDLSVRENLTLALLPRLTRRGASSPRRASASSSSASCARSASRPRDMDQPIRELSGGNQQKVLLGALARHRAATCCSSTSRRAASTSAPSARSRRSSAASSTRGTACC